MTIVQPPARDVRLAASVDRSIRLISTGSSAGSTCAPELAEGP